MTNSEQKATDEERHRRTQEVNDRAQQAIADAKSLVEKLTLSLNELESYTTAKEGAHRAK